MSTLEMLAALRGGLQAVTERVIIINQWILGTLATFDIVVHALGWILK